MNVPVEFIGDQAEYEAFKDFITVQALKQLHGQPFECTWKGQSLESYFKRKETAVKSYPYLTKDDEDDYDLL